MATQTFNTTASLGWQPPVRREKSVDARRILPIRYYSDKDDQIHKGLFIQLPEYGEEKVVLLEFNDANESVVAILMATILNSLPIAKNFSVVDQSIEQILSSATSSVTLPGFPGGSGSVTAHTDLHYIREASDYYFQAGFVVSDRKASANQLHHAWGDLRILQALCPEDDSLFRSLSLADRAYTTGRSEFLELLSTRYGWFFKYSYLDNRGESRTGDARVFDFAFNFFSLLCRRGGIPINGANPSPGFENDRFFDASLSANVTPNIVNRLVIDLGEGGPWESCYIATASDYINYENQFISGLRRVTFHKDGQSDFHIYFDTSKTHSVQTLYNGGADVDFMRISGAETSPLGSLLPALPTGIASGQVIDQPTGSMITGRLHADADIVVTDTLANLIVALTSHLAKRHFACFSTTPSALPAFGGVPTSSSESLQPIIDALAHLTELVLSSEGRFDRLDDGQRASLIATAESLLPPDNWGSHTDRVLALENVIKATFPATLGDISLFGNEVEGGPNE